MKKTKKLLPLLLSLMMCATMAMPLVACNDSVENSGGNSTSTSASTSNSNSGSGSSGNSTDKQPSVNILSPSLLDGKVANLLSASGIAIQDKTKNEAPVSALKSKNARKIVASAEESATMEQPETELVKQTEEGVQDVHFHDGEKGDYTEWNEETHHHDGQECDVEGCMEISDEILAEEENAPTVISLDARVNKLYNSGKFTFMCVSSAIEGRARLFTQTSRVAMGLSMQFFSRNGAMLNVDGHYFSDTDRSFTVSYMQVEAGDKKGYILVKRSDAEEGYHYANYWSDDFNQSYIIDNETGKTYSLSELPYIYSVQNGVIVTKTDTSETLYQPQIDENGNLVLTQIVISEDLQAYPREGYLADIHGNVVFTSRQIISGADIYGEVRKGGFIFTGISEVVQQQIQATSPRQYVAIKTRAYTNAKRYLVGSDGQIYRFDFRGDFRSVPVHVLNAQGEWVDVPQDAHVKFSAKDSFFVEATINAANWQYIILTQIKGGKTYFANAAYGTELPFTRNNYPLEYAQFDYFVGVTALPTDGSSDTEMQTFMQNVKEAGILDRDSIVYRVGDTAFAYEDKQRNELVIWDRETETRQTIACGDVIEGSLKGWHICFMQDRAYESACFQANTASGAYYVSYDEKNPIKAWNEYSTTPFEKEENLDAYYELLSNIKK